MAILRIEIQKSFQNQPIQITNIFLQHHCSPVIVAVIPVHDLGWPWMTRKKSTYDNLKHTFSNLCSRQPFRDRLPLGYYTFINKTFWKRIWNFEKDFEIIKYTSKTAILVDFWCIWRYNFLRFKFLNPGFKLVWKVWKGRKCFLISRF